MTCQKLSFADIIRNALDRNYSVEQAVTNMEKYNLSSYGHVEYDPEVLERVKQVEAPAYRRFYSRQA